MRLLCYIVKHFFFIPPNLVVWRRTTSQIRTFASGIIFPSTPRSRKWFFTSVFPNKFLYESSILMVAVQFLSFKSVQLQ
jgi:hypothetical protein